MNDMVGLYVGLILLTLFNLVFVHSAISFLEKKFTNITETLGLKKYNHCDGYYPSVGGLLFNLNKDISDLRVSSRNADNYIHSKINLLLEEEGYKFVETSYDVTTKVYPHLEKIKKEK